MSQFWKNLTTQAADVDRSIVGRRIRVDVCTDPHTHLEPGQEGTVSSVDDLGTVHVRWDSGSTLGLVAAAGDRWTLLDNTPGDNTP